MIDPDTAPVAPLNEAICASQLEKLNVHPVEYLPVEETIWYAPRKRVLSGVESAMKELVGPELKVPTTIAVAKIRSFALVSVIVAVVGVVLAPLLGADWSFCTVAGIPLN